MKKILATLETEPDVDLEREADRSEVRAIAEEILRAKSEDVHFFSGDSGGNALFARARSIVGSLSDETEKFLDYLTTSNSTRLLLKDNNMKIHLHSRQFYVKNRIVEGDSLYDFLIVQEDKTKQTIKQKLALTKDFDYYNNEILFNITNDVYHLRTNSTSKFIFYHYNAVRENEELKPAAVRHSQILKDENALEQLQNRDWQYFITTLLQNPIDGLGHEKVSSIEERNILVSLRITSQGVRKHTEKLMLNTFTLPYSTHHRRTLKAFSTT